MNAFERLVAAISATMEVPPMYGWLHLLFCGLVVVLTVLLLVFFLHADLKKERRILLAVWLVMLLVELYKQLVFSMEVADGAAVWEYDWYYFPFQLCSTPIFVLPFAILLPEGRVRLAAVSYIASFALFGGLAVMVYPGNVLYHVIGINLQTMIHHGLQVVSGLYLAARYCRRPFLPHFLSAIPVFLILLAVALFMNIGFREEGLNMFFVGPYVPSTLPILESVYPILPYPVFLIAYVLGFTLVAALVQLLGRALGKILLR